MNERFESLLKEKTVDDIYRNQLSTNTDEIEKFTQYLLEEKKINPLDYIDSLDGLMVGGFKFGYIILPKNVEIISDDCFKNDPTIYKLIIENNEIDLGYNCFNNCSLNEIYFNGSKEEWNELNKRSGIENNNHNIIIHCIDGFI